MTLSNANDVLSSWVKEANVRGETKGQCLVFTHFVAELTMGGRFTPCGVYDVLKSILIYVFLLYLVKCIFEHLLFFMVDSLLNIIP